MFDNSLFSNTTRFTFTFTVQGSQPFGCQLAANGGPVTSDQVLGGAQGGSFKNVACSQSNATRYPVTTSTGNFWHSFDDLGIPGRGFPLALRRTYNAHPGTAVPDGPLGFGWSFTYGMKLTVGPSNVVLTEEGGSRITFSGSGPTYTAPPRIVASLVRDVPSPGLFTLTRRAQETLVFNSSGQLLSQRDLNGHTTTLSYVSGHLDTVTDAAGRTLSFAWVGSPPHVKTVTDANEPSKPARVVTFSYGTGDTGPDLTEVLDVTGGRTNFAYDANHRMTRMRLPNQYDPALAIGVDPEVVANVYDASGRVTSQTDQLGRTTSFDYTTVAGSVLVTEPAGSTDAAGNPVTHARLDTYSSGLLVSQTLGYGTPVAATWAREYDPVTLGCTKVTDPNGHEWKATYDAAGNRTSTTDPLGRKVSWTWTANNLLKTVVDPRGNEPGADPAHWTTTLDYDDAGCACNLVRRSRPLLNAAGTAVVATQVTQYRHGERGNHAGDLTTVVDPLAKEWTTDYDGDGNPTKVTDPLVHTTTAVFDRWGRLTSETSPRGNLGPTPDPAFTRQFTYDPDNRLRTTSVANPPGPALTTAATFDANRNLATSTDGNGNPTTYEYDAANQARFVRRADTTSTETQYWPDGSLRAQLDGAGAATRYFYDAQGRPTTVIDPAGRATVSAFDPGGNPTTTQEPGGNCAVVPKVGCTTYGYDVADQLKVVTYSDAITPNVTNIDYFANGARQSMTEVTKASPAVTSTSSWAWDSLDRLLSSTDVAGASVAYAYDLRGALTDITYPGVASPLRRGFDDAGRLQWVQDWLGNRTDFGYDRDDNLTTKALPAGTGVVDTMTYDNAGRVKATSLAKAGSPFASFAYGRDGVDQVTSLAATGVPTDNHAYGYTKLNQLCFMAGPGATGTCDPPPSGAASFDYDPADNLVTLDETTQAFDASNQLCWTAPAGAGTCATPPAGATTFAYDARGNRTRLTPPSGPASDFGYDQADRLTSARAYPTPPVTDAGYLRVTTSPALPSQVSVDGIPRDTWGLTWMRIGPGNHQVCFADVEGWQTPACQTVTVTMGATAHVEGTFVQRGLLQVGTSPPVPATISVDGIARNDWGMFTDLPTGAHRVCFGAVADFTAPACQDVTLSPGQTTNVIGTYATNPGAAGESGRGLLRVTTDPSLPSQISVDGQPADTWGLTWAKFAPGSHTVCFRSVAGWTTPACQTVSVAADETTTVTGSFTRRGTLKAQTSPVLAATVSVDGVPRNDWGMFTDLPAGPHEVCFSAVAGHGPPPCQFVTLTAGAQTTVTGTYDATTTYAYDADGRRMARTSGASTTTYTWDQASELPMLLAEGSGSSSARYVYGPGGLPLERIDAAGQVLWYHQDQLGSTRVLTDSSGSVAGTSTYDPYGTVAASTGSVSQPFGFAGQYSDAETRFQYLRARYYDPATGQFLTRDPIEAVTREAYQYAANNPLNATDPSGMVAFVQYNATLGSIAAGAGAGLVGAAAGHGAQRVGGAKTDPLDILAATVIGGLLGPLAIRAPLGVPATIVGGAAGLINSLVTQLYDDQPGISLPGVVGAAGFGAFAGAATWVVGANQPKLQALIGVFFGSIDPSWVLNTLSYGRVLAQLGLMATCP